MADIELVIKIPEKVYKSIQDNYYCGISNLDMYNALKDGTPLPKGHGRLIDVDDLLDIICLDNTDENREDNVGEIVTLEDIDFIPTIIEADEEVEE